MLKALARLFYIELRKIEKSKEQKSIKQQVLLELLHKIFIEVTSEEQIPFTTMFARISYAGQKFNLQKQTLFYIHYFRRGMRDLNAAVALTKSDIDFYLLGLKVVSDSIAQISGMAVPDKIKAILPNKLEQHIKRAKIQEFRKKVRAVLLEDNALEAYFTAVEEERGIEVKVRYNLLDRNENFNPSIRQIRRSFRYPLVVNLIDVETDENDMLRPRAIVIHPDFLMDVTSIAECFQPENTQSINYLLKKFLPFTPGIPLIVGNIANYFLDELMTNSELNFKEVFPKVFQLFPLSFALLEDQEIIQIMNKSKDHFMTLKKMVQKEFEKNDIYTDHCYLEPTFYSERFGIQGRLDAFHEQSGNSAIIELKSGRPFRPNLYGISHNHFTQTLLYDLLIKSAFKNKYEPTNYILYSRNQQDKPLRYAPVVQAEQMEALQVRNQLVSIEQRMASIDVDDGRSLDFNKIAIEKFPQLKGFHLRDLALFEKVIKALSLLEKQYFRSFAGFIAREHQLSKTGIEGIDNINGMASIWLNTFEEKEESFDIISYLKIKKNLSDDLEPVIVFERTERTNPLANFRKGDVATLYPYSRPGDSALDSQVFKVTIIELTKNDVAVRLRSRQFNKSIFGRNNFWNLEHDLLDSSYVGMYRALFQFMASERNKRDLLLTLKAPSKPAEGIVDAPDELTKEQQKIFKKMVFSQDYFLLWGPPGTGKTSMMLKHLSGYYFNQTQENILLLAYTNRAVDEICAAIEQIGPKIKDYYLRIGSRYGTATKYQEQLLDHKIKDINSRRGLLEIIKNHRIFVGTVSSFSGKSELLKLKKFHRVIIDEASQILEPVLGGLLPQFDHFTLIGDHLQLPAVVVQDEKNSEISHPDLQAIGLKNMRNSLFERLFLKCQENKWNWAYDKLSHQGRMHTSIMQFPNDHFYGGFLKILPEKLSSSKGQKEALDLGRFEEDAFLKSILKQRIVVLPTSINDDLRKKKTNEDEANKVVQLVSAFRMTEPKADIGVITPYRAQIAMIRSKLHQANIDPDDLTVDTVERYQGGARDIIIISLCTNSVTQMTAMTSLTAGGVDRKLNVALTRARKYLVVLGNPEIMQENEYYALLWGKYGVEK